jgi:hypothetical protein
MILVTNIFVEDIKREDFKEIYDKRWDIKTCYDLIKSKLGLENSIGIAMML